MTSAPDLDLQGQGTGVPDIVPKLRKRAYQDGLKGQLASLGSLHNHDICPGI